MRTLQERLEGKYLATRATGSGGGGCMIFYTDDKEGLSHQISDLSGRGKSPEGVRVIQFEFEYDGIRAENKRI